MAYTKYSLTPANNTSAPPDGAPEGMLPSAVNDTMRDMMAQIRDCGDGVRDGTYTMTAPKITGGTITGVTLTGNTFSSPIVSGGTINNATIGATTASTGAFSTLSASGVATFSAGTVSLPAITTTGDTNTGIFFPAADTIAFTEGGAESMRIDSSGNLLVGITTARANAGDVQVSKGISFPATQSAQSDANTLDDYEEGTWTPGYTSWLVNPTVSSTAKYTKIGRLVTVSVYLTGGTTQAGSQISGLPFTCDTEASMISTNGTTSSLVFYGVVLGSNTVIGSLSAQTLTSTFYAVTATYFTT